MLFVFKHVVLDTHLSFMVSKRKDNMVLIDPLRFLIILSHCLTLAGIFKNMVIVIYVWSGKMLNPTMTCQKGITIYNKHGLLEHMKNKLI